MFTFRDAYAAKFYFDRLRLKNNVLFDPHYNICESILKNGFVCQQIGMKSLKKDEILLDLGCGNGHLSRTISRLYQMHCIGFDPKLNLKIRIQNFKFNFKNSILGNSGRVRLYKKDYKQFVKKFGLSKFTIIIDNCSVTHFEPGKYGSINNGWGLLVEDLSTQMRPNSIFICATDVVIGNRINSEFCYEKDLLEYFEKSFDILNKNMINIDDEFYKIESHYSEILNFNFKRVPPPNTVEGQALGILGFVAKRKTNL